MPKLATWKIALCTLPLLASCNTLQPQPQTSEVEIVLQQQNLDIQELQNQLKELQGRYQEVKTQNEQLQQMLQEQQETLEETKQAALESIENTWLENFSLLENAVADTTRSTEQELASLKKELKHIKHTAPQTTKPKSEIPTSSSDKIVLPKKTGESKVIEDYKLKSTPMTKPKAAVPVAQTSKPENKPKATPSKVPTTPQAIAATEPDEAPTPPKKTSFSDPNLKNPKHPYLLQRYPGAKEVYNQGMSEIIQENYDDAIQTFDTFLSKFPDDYDSDNAQFWIGHAYLKQNNYEKAILSLKKVLKHYEHFPTSQGYKTPDAIYLLGQIALKQQRMEEAAYYFQETLKRFPDSAAARNAESDLKLLQVKP